MIHDPKVIADAAASAQERLQAVLSALSRAVVGQDYLKRRLLTALLTQGHILLEGVPGLGKTLAIKAFASAVHASFKRIQFTPDLLPADLIGTEIFRPQDGAFEVRKGPVFANIVLADEVNRAPAKVQAALLETMQERQVTIGKETFSVPRPFLVLATQNPIEHEGTYPLPEAQLDRFLMKVEVTYPTPEEELQMLDLVPGGEAEQISPVIGLEEIGRLQDLCRAIYVDAKVKKYIVDLVNATRYPEQFKLPIKQFIEVGASPRSSLALQAAARAEALIAGQGYVTPQFVKDVAPDILRHRLLLSFEADAEEVTPDKLIRQILDSVPVP